MLNPQSPKHKSVLQFMVFLGYLLTFKLKLGIFMYSIPSSDRLHALDRTAELGHTFWIPGGTQKEQGPVSSQVFSMRRTCFPLL